MVKIPLFGGQSGAMKAYLDEDMDAERCKKHPAGYPITMKSGKSACLFLYDKNGEPINGYEVENISPAEITVKHRETGQRESFQV